MTMTLPSDSPVPPLFRRVILIVLDSVGVGEMPDAERFGDGGSDTLGHVCSHRPLRLPHLQRLGLANIRPLAHQRPACPPLGCFGRAALASPGKDTTCGHWEMMGVVLEKPFPVYPQGFPEEVVEAFQKAIGRKVLGNRPASGTEIIQELGEEHLRSGFPILYTSADSVFQLAAHQEIIPPEKLYEMCRIARELLQGEHQVGRVIARPFRGSPGRFVRTEARRDFAIPPPAPTVLDALQKAQVPVVAIGKIASIYCHRGVDVELPTKNNSHTGEVTIQALHHYPGGLIFANFVDFDMLYGHRNNVEGYASALEEFDRFLGDLLPLLQPSDLLILTSDHGCDPTTPSTDHSREYALLLTFAPRGSGGRDLGLRRSLADVGATVADNFGVPFTHGTSFLPELVPR